MSNLIKSKKRVADHGEVFTPSWLVETMLNRLKHETDRIDARILEPACGSGNFLVPILKRKLNAVDKRYKQSSFERTHHSLLALMCTYGIELLSDNAEECRANLLEVFASHLGANSGGDEVSAARVVLAANIVQGDALRLKNHHGEPIVFPEWSYLGKGLFKRRDFKFDELIQLSSYGEGTLFESLDPDQIFAPVKDYPLMNIAAISQNVGEPN